MNQRQQKRFEERFGSEEEAFSYAGTAGVHLNQARRAGYIAACQDEGEAIKGLVEALQACRDFIVTHDDEGLVAHSDLIQNADKQLKAWKGE